MVESAQLYVPEYTRAKPRAFAAFRKAIQQA